MTISSDDDNPGLMAVILPSPTGEFQFRSPLEDLINLRSIREADFSRRRTLHIGTVFGVPLHWCINDEIVSALVGPDDETWQIALTMPVEAVDRLVEAAADLQPAPPEPDPGAPLPG